MKIVFFGTSHFSAAILKFLYSLPHEICAVVTRVDKPQGRDLRMGASPVKQILPALSTQISILQPEKASTDEFAALLKTFKADLFLVVAYGEILKESILSIPTKASVNIHTSLLPKYRGAAPIQRCLMNGDLESGVTFMEMVLKMDAGDILLQERVGVPEDMDMASLEASLLSASQRRLAEFLEHFDEYYAKKIPQSEKGVSFAAKITSEDCVIDWSKSSVQIHNQIRALSPSPGAYTKIQFGSEIKRFKILKARSLQDAHKQPFGYIWIQNSSLYVAAGVGVVELLEVQIEGKRSMLVSDFLRGVPKQFSLVL